MADYQTQLERVRAIAAKACGRRISISAADRAALRAVLAHLDAVRAEERDACGRLLAVQVIELEFEAFRQAQGGNGPLSEQLLAQAELVRRLITLLRDIPGGEVAG